MSDIEIQADELNKPKHARWIVLAIIIAAFFVGCPLFYISDSVDGRIVDAETGEPIANAHIVGIWQLEGGIIEHAYLGPLHFEETVTDIGGRYHLEGFSLRFVEPNLSLAQLEDHDPIIYTFAEGYQPKGVSAHSKHKGIYRNSSLNGKDIPLQKMPEITELEARSWYSSVSSMKSDLSRCDLIEIPNTVDFIMKMYAKFGDAASDYRFVYSNEYNSCR